MVQLKLVVMGAGLIGREHCQLIQNHPRAILAGIADPSPEAIAYANQLGIPHFINYEKMLDDVKPDGAIIALPNKLHEPAGLSSLNRKIPCLIEKPIADILSSALALVQASEKTGVPVLVGHHRRHSPDIRTARDIVRSGDLGELVAVNGLWLCDKPDNYFDADWRRQPGGGPLLINLIHEIDCLRYIVGEISEVRAFSSNATREFEVEDTLSVSIRFENGALGSFLLSDAVASPYSWEVTSGQALYFPHQAGDCYKFGGRKATLAVPSMSVWRHSDNSKNWQDPIFRETVNLEPTRAYQNQLDHLLDVITEVEPPVITARDAMTTLAATLAVGIAAQEDRTVSVSDLIADQGL